MGQLTEYLKSEADYIRGERQRRRQELDEWVGMLADLYAQIDTWLAAIDPDGLLDITKDTVVLNDPALGYYQVPTRQVAIGYNSVDIVPRTRRTASTIRPPASERPVRGHGLVEIRGAVRSCYLYQLPGPSWFIQAERRERGDDIPVVPVDADNFEAALAGFLR